MKKKIKKIASVALMGLVLWSPLATQTSAAELDPISPQKVMWGANELVKGQIGRIVFLKDVKLYKRDANGPSFHRVAKKGSLWRVYEIKNINGISVYNLGGNVFVSQSNLSAYEKAPSEKIQALGVKVNIVESRIPGEVLGRDKTVSYAQFSGMLNKNLEKTLNSHFLNLANEAKKEQLAVAELEAQDPLTEHRYEYNMYAGPVYNFNNKLSISVSEYKIVNDTGTTIRDENYTLDLMTGKRLQVKDILTTKEQIEKVNKYLKEHYYSVSEIDLNTDNFYFVDQVDYVLENEMQVPVHTLGIRIPLKGGIYIPKEIYN
ncbi:MAG TPA: hypothetical protein VNM45_08150 [Bacillus sp. (in: firmicutes)]|nr:hypothetical protein [Bacillus sp. (in: firmicutes)]